MALKMQTFIFFNIKRVCRGNIVLKLYKFIFNNIKTVFRGKCRPKTVKIKFFLNIKTVQVQYDHNFRVFASFRQGFLCISFSIYLLGRLQYEFCGTHPLQNLKYPSMEFLYYYYYSKISAPLSVNFFTKTTSTK